jgi:hypothetical protein
METTKHYATVAVFAGTIGVASSSSSLWSYSSSSTTSSSACRLGIGVVTTLGVPGEEHDSYRTRS